LRGELRISNTLTPAEEANVNTIISNHNSAVLSDGQQRQDQDATDLNTIRTGFNNWDTLNNTQRFAVLKLAIRILLRKERDEAI